MDFKPNETNSNHKFYLIFNPCLPNFQKKFTRHHQIFSSYNNNKNECSYIEMNSWLVCKLTHTVYADQHKVLWASSLLSKLPSHSLKSIQFDDDRVNVWCTNIMTHHHHSFSATKFRYSITINRDSRCNYTY